MPFNAPPNWPTPPTGWTPGPDWTPPTEWGPAPDGWDFGGWQPTEPPSSRGIRRATSTFVKHPLWTTLGAFIGVVGVVISGVQIYQSTQSAPADLEVAMTSIGGPEQIKAIGYDRGSKKVDLDIPVGEFRANPIDLTLKNNGGQPSLITKVVADVKHFELLRDCTRSGAGPAGISAEYTFRIPTEPNGQVKLGKHDHDVRFETKPGAVDRMALTIGPDIETFYNTPYVLGVHFILVAEGGKELDAGSYTIVGNHKAIETNLDGVLDPACSQKNLETLETIYAFQSTKAPELDQLRDTFRTNVASSSAGSSAAPAGG